MVSACSEGERSWKAASIAEDSEGEKGEKWVDCVEGEPYSNKR
jgi:hypothetical protein